MERVPILKMGNLLLVTIQGDIYDSVSVQLQDDLAAAINKHNSKGLLFDISSLTIIDSFMGRIINNIASMAKLMDTKTVVVGMQPSVAITLVEFGLEMPDVITALDVERGMARLDKYFEESHLENEMLDNVMDVEPSKEQNLEEGT